MSANTPVTRSNPKPTIASNATSQSIVDQQLHHQPSTHNPHQPSTKSPHQPATNNAQQPTIPSNQQSPSQTIPISLSIAPSKTPMFSQSPPPHRTARIAKNNTTARILQISSKPISLCSQQQSKPRSLLHSKSTTSRALKTPKPKKKEKSRLGIRSPPSSSSSQKRKFSIKSWYDPKKYQEAILKDSCYQQMMKEETCNENKNKNGNGSRVCLNIFILLDDPTFY